MSGGIELVACDTTGQPRLDVADAFEAEPADQAAGEAGHACELGHDMLRAQRLDFGERIGDLAALDQFAMVAHVQGVPAEGVHAAHRQADDRVATEAFAAFDRFEQVGVRGIGELEIDRQRRVQIGQHFADDGDAGVTFSGVALELLAGNQDGFPSGTR